MGTRASLLQAVGAKDGRQLELAGRQLELDGRQLVNAGHPGGPGSWSYLSCLGVKAGWPTVR